MLLNRQQEKVFEIISSRTDKLRELKEEKEIVFRNKGLGKQYKNVQKTLASLNRVKKALKKKKIEKALDEVRDLIESVEEQGEDLLIADTSKHGWLTVFNLRGKKNLPSDLMKKIDKIDSKIDREKSSKDGWKKRGGYKGDEEVGSAFRQGLPRRRPGPEETMQSLTKSRRQGQCSHCNEYGHFYKECSKFWQQVSEQRKKAAAETN